MAELWRVSTTINAPQGGPYYNQLHFLTVALQGPDNQMTAVAGFWDDLRPSMRTGTTINVSGEVEKIESTTGAIVGLENETGSTHVGTSSGDPLPAATQGLLRFRTGVYDNGREIRGRIFIPCLTATSASGGRPSTTFRNLLVQASGNLTANGLVVFSPTKNLFAESDTVSAWSEFAVLRSRRD